MQSTDEIFKLTITSWFDSLNVFFQAKMHSFFHENDFQQHWNKDAIIFRSEFHQVNTVEG